MFYKTVENHVINSVINFLQQHEVKISRFAVRESFFRKPTFPATTLPDVSEQFHAWGIANKIQTFSEDSSLIIPFPTIAAIRLNTGEVQVVLLEKEDELGMNILHPEWGSIVLKPGHFELLNFLQVNLPVSVSALILQESADLEEREKKAYLDSIFTVKNFLSEEECAYMISYCEENSLFNRSEIGFDGEVSEERTSYSAVLKNSRENNVFHAIIKRAASLMEVPEETVEILQCVRYGQGQEFKPHYDSFEEENLCRQYTMLVYLNDDYAGGETAFTELGIRVSPKKGLALGFLNINEQKNIHIYSMHAGMPVTGGVKYACNIWIRDKIGYPVEF